MVQTFMVVRCFKCETFQVELVKKSNKWKCKVCGERQSVRQIYGKGQAPDCRRHVQRLNSMRGEQERDRACLPSPPEQYLEENPVINGGEDSKQPLLLESTRWAAFIAPEKQSGVDDGEEEGEGEATEVSLVSGYHFTTESFEESEQDRKRFKKEKHTTGLSIFPSTAKYDFSSKHNVVSSSSGVQAITVAGKPVCHSGEEEHHHDNSVKSKWSQFVDDLCSSDSSDDALLFSSGEQGVTNQCTSNQSEHDSSKDHTNTKEISW